MADPPAAQPTLCRLLTLDGGGAKGFYTLGVLKEIEALIGTPLCQRFEPSAPQVRKRLNRTSSVA